MTAQPSTRTAVAALRQRTGIPETLRHCVTASLRHCVTASLRHCMKWSQALEMIDELGARQASWNSRDR